MDTKKRTQIIVYICATAIIFFMIYNIVNNQEHVNNVKAKITESEANTQATQPKEVIAVDVARITSSTKLIYEYYYTDNSEVKREEVIAPYFLVDMSLEDIKQRFPDWQLQSFSEKEVIMRKSINKKEQERYIIGIHEGYVAVFFEEPVNGQTLRELTNTPIESLSPGDRAKLKAGITITGAKALISALEDYES